MKRLLFVGLCLILSVPGLAWAQNHAQTGGPDRQPITSETVLYLERLEMLPLDRPEQDYVLGSGARDVAFSPDGAYLAVAGPGPVVHVIDMATREIVHTLRDYTDDVHSVAYSPDGSMLVSASRWEVRLWEVLGDGTLRDYATLGGYDGAIDDVVFSPDSARIAFGVAGGKARIWDIAARWTTTYIDGFGWGGYFHETDTLAFSPDGHWLMMVKDDESVGGWSLGSERFYGGIGERGSGFYTVAFSPDLRWFVAVYDTHLASGATSMAVLDGLLVDHLGFVDSDRWITRVVFNHGGGDGSTLLAGISGTYTGNGLVFWDVAHPTEAYMGYFRQIHQIGLDSQPLAAVFSPDDCWMAVGTGSGVELWGIPADFIIPPTPTPTATFTPRPTSTPWPTPGPFELSQTPPYYTSTPTITLTPSLTPLPTATFTLSPTPLVLAIGGQARVQTVGGDTLSVRNVPGLDSDILARLEHGALVTLLDGPREVDGYVWWQLRTADGVEGWAVQAADDVQTLVPVG